MDEKRLNKVLKDRARELGLCDQWYDEWERRSTRQELIDKYLRGIDFCIKHDYPRLEFIKAYFEPQELMRNGIYVDRAADAVNPGTVVLLGDATGRLNYDGLTVGKVYLRHNTVCSIEAMNGARVFVEVYENAALTITADEYSRAFVYQHGGVVKSDGNVVLRDKRVVKC